MLKFKIRKVDDFSIYSITESFTTLKLILCTTVSWSDVYNKSLNYVIKKYTDGKQFGIFPLLCFHSPKIIST
jgi:hypothetical protein